MRLTRIFFLCLIFLPGIKPVNAQFYFGRNKIQYEQFEWKKLTTDHFEIYFYSGAEELSRKAAAIAEEAFPIMETKFNHTFNHRTPLVIYSSHIHFQQTNILPHFIPEGVGGFFEFMKGRVAIPFTGDMQDFQHVIRHELVHVFMHRKISHHLHNEGINDPPMIPLWFSEGLAEVWSQEWTSQAEMIIRDAVIHDQLLLLDSYELSAKGYLLYKEGESFLRYFQKTFGADKIRKLLEEYGRYDFFSQAFTSVSDKPYIEIMEDWQNNLNEKTLPLSETNTDTANNIKQLTEKGPNVSPAIYREKDGSDYLVYLSNRSGYTDIFSLNLDSGIEQKILKGERKAEQESLHFLQTGLSVNRNGILAYVTKSGAGDVIRLYDLNSGKETQVFNYSGLISIRSPKWSKAGDKIVFSGQDFHGRYDIYIWNPGSDTVIRIMKDFFSDYDPEFSPDGSSIVFSSDRNENGSRDLFLYEIEPVTIRILTRDQYRNTKPHWDRAKPNTINFISDRSGLPAPWSLRLAKDSSKFELTQKTSLNTGIVDAVDGPDGSIIINQFREYSFNFSQIPADSIFDSFLNFENLNSSSQSTLGQNWSSIDTSHAAPYQLDYSLDFAQTAVAYDPIYGFLGGGQLAISDVLGNKYYHFLLANSANVSSEILDRFNVAVTMMNLTRRSNIAWSIFHFANDFYNPYDSFYFERMFGVRAGVNFPINIFRRVELSSSLWYSSKDFYDGNKETAILASNFFSFIQDNSIWSPVGPIDGWRLRFTIGPTFDFQRSAYHNVTSLFDLRTYFRLHSRVTFAQRTLVWMNEGKDLRRYYIGGSWGLRGYSWNEIYGKKVFLLNHELRFPVVEDLSFKFRTYQIGFRPIRGALFIDAGSAWDFGDPEIKGTAGFGLRGSLMGAFVLRLDVGKRTDFKSFEKDWFTQFFFGWDF